MLAAPFSLRPLGPLSPRRQHQSLIAADPTGPPSRIADLQPFILLVKDGYLSTV
jgi:hypothetical protein